jgi:hypothetical protein
MTKMLNAGFYTQTIRNRSSVITLEVCKRGSVNHLNKIEDRGFHCMVVFRSWTQEIHFERMNVRGETSSCVRFIMLTVIRNTADLFVGLRAKM